MRPLTILRIPLLPLLLLAAATPTLAAPQDDRGGPAPGERVGRRDVAGAAVAEPDPSESTDAGRATAKEQSAADQPTCFGQQATVDDRSGQIFGTAAADVIVGNDGDNSIDLSTPGQAGVDRVCGNGGKDRVDARGNDDGRLLARGGANRDELLGTSANDELFGGDGNDDLKGFNGTDHLVGGPGDDSINSGGGADRIDGGPGDDEIDIVAFFSAQPGTVTVKAGDGDDTIEAADGDRDEINCGPGKDAVEFDAGIDEIKNCERKQPVTL